MSAPFPRFADRKAQPVEPAEQPISVLVESDSQIDASGTTGLPVTDARLVTIGLLSYRIGG
jgi:hypothetical protein